VVAEVVAAEVGVGVVAVVGVVAEVVVAEVGVVAVAAVAVELSRCQL
jgi:hypothetical protein